MSKTKDMEFEQVYGALEEMGTAQNRKVYKRHGASDNMFGVSTANLKDLKKKIKVNHSVAIKLWATNNMDAQCLATMIADPNLLVISEALQWAEDSTYYNLTDLLVSNLLFKTKYAQELCEELIRGKSEYLKRAGWKLLALFALQKNNLPDAYFIPYVSHIEQNIHEAENRVREAMNTTLIAIGCRNENLESISLRIADSIGEVIVDHGKTSCKTPDVRSYLIKVKNRKRKNSSVS